MPKTNTNALGRKGITYKGNKAKLNMPTPKSCQMNKERIDDLGRRLDKIEEKLDNIMTKDDFKEWKAEFKTEFCQKVEGRLCTLEEKSIKTEVSLSKIFAVASAACLVIVWVLGQLKLIGI